MSLKWKGVGRLGGLEEYRRVVLEELDVTWMDKVGLDGQGGYLKEDYMNTLYG